MCLAGTFTARYLNSCGLPVAVLTWRPCYVLQVKELDAALEAIRWGMDYLLNCHSAPFQFVAMFGSSEVRSQSCRCYTAPMW